MYLWSDGRKDEAFEALDNALAQLMRCNEYCAKGIDDYTAPLVRMVKYDLAYDCADNDSRPRVSCGSLIEDWPWWRVPEESTVRPEIQTDPRWNEWAAKARACDKEH